MMKNNLHKKYTKEDKFARKFYCDNSRLAQLRSEKKAQKKKFRKEGKKMCEEIEDFDKEEDDDEHECYYNACNICAVYLQACPFNSHDCVDCEMFKECKD